MKRQWRSGSGAALASIWVVATLLDIFLRDPALVGSGAGALQSALASALLAWPLTAGIACAEVVRVLRPATRELTLALPNGARVSLVVRRAALIALWSLIGLTASVALACTIAGVNGSFASPSVYLATIPVAAGTVAVAALGAFIGVIARSWVAPPLVALGIYVFYVFSPNSAGGLLAFSSGEGRVVVSLVPRGVAVLGLTLAFAVLTAGFTLLLAARLTNRAAWAAVGLVTIVSGLAIIGPATSQPYKLAGSGSWACTPLGSPDLTFCLPKEQAGDLAAAGTELQPLALRMSRALGDGAPLTFAPVGDGSHTFPVPIPFGAIEGFGDDAAQSVADYVVNCPGSEQLDPEVAFSNYLALLGWMAPNLDLSAPGEEAPVPYSDSEAHDFMVAGLAACGS